jgi:hypothetical protein
MLVSTIFSRRNYQIIYSWEKAFFLIRLNKILKLIFAMVNDGIAMTLPIERYADLLKERQTRLSRIWVEMLQPFDKWL